MTRFQISMCEQTLLREIAEPTLKRSDIAQTYRLAMQAQENTEEKIDWGKVNRAIIARWSFSALLWIKKQAWSGKCFQPGA